MANGSIMSRLRASLEANIKCVVITYLNMFYIYDSFELTEQQLAERLAHSAWSQPGASQPPLPEAQRGRLAAQSLVLLNLTSKQWKSNTYGWLALLIQRYQFASTMMHVYLVVRELARPWHEALNRWLHLRLPLDCYLVGQFSLLVDYARPIMPLVSGGHLLWRAIQAKFTQTSYTDGLIFAIQDESTTLREVYDYFGTGFTLGRPRRFFQSSADSNSSKHELWKESFDTGSRRRASGDMIELPASLRLLQADEGLLKVDSRRASAISENNDHWPRKHRRLYDLDWVSSMKCHCNNLHSKHPRRRQDNIDDIEARLMRACTIAISRARHRRDSRPIHLIKNHDIVIDDLESGSNNHQDCPYQEPSRNAQVLRMCRLVLCMYYPVKGGHEISYRLRPNRTRLAHGKLVWHLALCATLNTLVFCSFVILVVPLVFISLLTDVSYLNRYSHCVDASSHGLQHELLGIRPQPWEAQFYRMSYWPDHKVATMPLDALANLFMWIDMMISVLCIILIVLSAVKDVELHWVETNRRAERVLREAGQLTGRGHMMERRLSGQVHALQSQLADFFNLLERSDKLVSDILTSSITLWFVSYAMCSYLSIKLAHGRLDLFVTFMQAAFFVAFTVLTFYLLALHHKALRTHKIICSLMAIDKSPGKSYFANLLDYYVYRNKCTFSVFRGQHSYMASTFLAIIGWTVSCTAIVRSMWADNR